MDIRMSLDCDDMEDVRDVGREGSAQGKKTDDSGNREGPKDHANGAPKEHANGAQNKRIKLNIGGIKHETTIDTINQIPDSMLARMISPLHNKLVCYDEEGAMCIDRDGEEFKYIMLWYRCLDLDKITKMLPTDPPTLERIKFECDFYQIQDITSKLIDYTEIVSLKVERVGDCFGVTGEVIMNQRYLFKLTVNYHKVIDHMYEKGNVVCKHCRRIGVLEFSAWHKTKSPHYLQSDGPVAMRKAHEYVDPIVKRINVTKLTNNELFLELFKHFCKCFRVEINDMYGHILIKS